MENSKSQVFSGQDPKKMLSFMNCIGRLKHLDRTGWILRNIKKPESVASHMYRMAILAFFLNERDGLDRNKCIQLALVHDMAEAIIGDLVPNSGIDPAEKHRIEDEGMVEMATLAGSTGKELYDLFQEYERQETAEAKFVKELDRLDMVMQAFEYEKSEHRPGDLQEFFDSTQGNFSHPLVLKFLSELIKQRQKFEIEAKDSSE